MVRQRKKNTEDLLGLVNSRAIGENLRFERVLHEAYLVAKVVVLGHVELLVAVVEHGVVLDEVRIADELVHIIDLLLGQVTRLRVHPLELVEVVDERLLDRVNEILRQLLRVIRHRAQEHLSDGVAQAEYAVGMVDTGLPALERQRARHRLTDRAKLTAILLGEQRQTELDQMKDERELERFFLLRRRVVLVQ